LPPKNDEEHDKPARVAEINQEMNPAAYEGGGPFDHDMPKGIRRKKEANNSQLT